MTTDHMELRAKLAHAQKVIRSDTAIVRCVDLAALLEAYDALVAEKKVKKVFVPKKTKE